MLYIFMDCFEFQLLKNSEGVNAAPCRYLIKIQSTLWSAGCKGVKSTR